MARHVKRKRRTAAEVEAVREAARDELAAGHPMTLRQVHYRLVSRDDVIHPNTISAYNTLGGWLRDDRLGGLVPWEWMDMEALSENARIERDQRRKLRDGIGRIFEDNGQDT